MFTEVMIDIETLSTHQNAAVLQIGAAAFSLKPDEPAMTLAEWKLDLNSQEARHISADTLKWWSTQPHLASMLNGKVPWQKALEELRSFIEVVTVGTKDVHVWANSPSFDLAILKSFPHKLPMWHFRNERDFRTARALFPAQPWDSKAVEHDALADATAQATHIRKILCTS
jgi:3' exoribonuclease, RNase T-like